MKGTTELRCPVCHSNQLAIKSKSMLGQTTMACNTCGHTFNSSEGKVVAVTEQNSAVNEDVSNSPSTTREFEKQVLDILQQKGLLNAVKFCKDTKGWGLKESKDYVDALAAQHGVKGKKGCFIATACYGDYNASEVLVLRAYRDNTLEKTIGGRLFIKLYYFFSPSLARAIARSARIKNCIRKYILAPMIKRIQQRSSRTIIK